MFIKQCSVYIHYTLLGSITRIRLTKVQGRYQVPWPVLIVGMLIRKNVLYSNGRNQRIKHIYIYIYTYIL